jgi:hypothetical protein
MNGETRKALLGRPATPVPAANLSVTLDVPFREPNDPETRTQSFIAALEPQADGTVRATLSFMDDWARLAYGALAYPGFQSEPARVHVAYAFRGYSLMVAGLIHPVFGGKDARTEIGRLDDARFAGRPVFDPAAVEARVGGGVLRFERESGPRPRALSRPHSLNRAGGPTSPPTRCSDGRKRTAEGAPGKTRGGAPGPGSGSYRSVPGTV